MKYYWPISICLITLGCIDSIEPELLGETPRILVIDATITDEVKQQRILLSRSNSLEEDGIISERNAIVNMSDGNGVNYEFTETNPGEYLSINPFAAQPGQAYKLTISTDSGGSYESEYESFTGTASLDSLYAERIADDFGEVGMAIYVDSFTPENDSQFYRFEYEETYKIIAPFWVARDLTFVNGEGIVIEPRPIEQRVCYTTDFSSDIVIENTLDLNEDRLEKFLVRFINRNNYIISHRYSILVRLIVHSNRANNYYDTLKTLTSLESVFSENQPGFINGNVFSKDDPSEPVLGYFEVASVMERRIFFNYEDFFPGEELPDYVSACQENTPELDVLIGQIQVNSIKLLNENDSPLPGEGPYITLNRVCGDCTVLGNPEIPEFWIEE